MTDEQQRLSRKFMDEVGLCLKRTRGIKRLMGRLEMALKDLTQEESNEIHTVSFDRTACPIYVPGLCSE